MSEFESNFAGANAGSSATAARRPAVSGWFVLTVTVLMFLSGSGLFAAEPRVFRCATSADVHRALDEAGPGDTILLEGGSVYEIDRSFMLEASGTEGRRIRLTSEDGSGAGRYAVITTVDQRKEPDLKALLVLGSYWHISRIEITGKRVPLEDGYWDMHGFQLGIYLLGPESHHNVVEDVRIHRTHNAAVAVRRDAHDITFRRLNIHHIGEWLDAAYNAHEAEGFYLGSSKGFDEEGNKARVNDILIEDSVVGPGVLGQFVDIKYAASRVTVRNNVFHCSERTYNEEVIKLAGYDSLIEGNRFVGSNPTLTRYIHIMNKKTRVPVRVDYLGARQIEAPTGRDNRVVGNTFYTDDAAIRPVQPDLVPADLASTVIERNRIAPMDEYQHGSD